MFSCYSLISALELNCCGYSAHKSKYIEIMSSEEDKPPAPPVRLTSNRGGSAGNDGAPPVDLRPLPKGNFHLYSYI